MASRKEEKEARRAERLAAEQAARKREQTRQRLLIGGGVLAGLIAIAAVVLVVASGGGDDSGGADGQTGPSVPIPARQVTDLTQAARRAGCVVRRFSSEGRGHLGSETAVNNNYRTNPPTSGTHRPTPAEDGIYAPGNEPDKENLVHTLEHGRIQYQYAPGTPARRIQQLETLFAEPLRGVSGYHQLVLRNNTNMPYAVAAVAWTRYAACERFTDATFDVFRAFREQFVDRAPEQVP